MKGKEKWKEKSEIGEIERWDGKKGNENGNGGKVRRLGGEGGFIGEEEEWKR